MCRRECLIGEPCEFKTECRAAEKRAAAQRAEVISIAKARKARARQEERLDWKWSRPDTPA